MKNNPETAVSHPTTNKDYSLWEEWKQQFKTSWPTLCSMIMYKLPWLISLRFVGALGAEELASAALATTLFSITGLSLSVGLSSALTTLTGQARGNLTRKHQRQIMKEHQEERPFLNKEKDSSVNNLSSQSETENSGRFPRSEQNSDGQSTKEEVLLPMVLLYRGLFVQLCFVAPVGICWLSGVRPILMALGQNAVISEMTSTYLRILAPGLWSYSINWTITAWLQAIELAYIPACTAGVGLLLHVPSNYFFIHTLGLDYLGSAVATVFFQFLQPIIILTYLFGTSNGRSRLLCNTVAAAVGRTCICSRQWDEMKLAVGSLDGIKTYLALAIPGIVAITEWWASEISIFLSGRLQPYPEVALSGMTLYQSLNTLFFQLPMSCSVAGATRVSNFLGAGAAERAAIGAKVSVASAIVASGSVALMLSLLPPHFFPSFFHPEDSVVEQTSRTIPLLAAYVFADGIQVALNGIIKGCGRQCVTIPIVLVAYWIVGLPLAYELAFKKNEGYMCEQPFCGVVGLVAGMTTGTILHMLLLLFVVARTDWRLEAKKTRERLQAPQEMPAAQDDLCSNSGLELSPVLAETSTEEEQLLHASCEKL